MRIQETPVKAFARFTQDMARVMNSYDLMLDFNRFEEIGEA
jgi:hypothetical protein